MDKHTVQSIAHRMANIKLIILGNFHIDTLIMVANDFASSDAEALLD